MQKKSIENSFFILLVIFVTVAFIILIQDFFQPLFWASVLAIIFNPLQKRWLKTFRGRANMASVASLFTVMFIVLLPLFFIGYAMTQEAMSLYDRVTAGEFGQIQPSVLFEEYFPRINEFLERFGFTIERVQQALSNAAVTASRFITSQLLQIGQNALRLGVAAGLMLYFLFFFLRDSKQIMNAVVRALPLSDVREKKLFSRFAEVSRATLKGTLVVGIIQGALGGFFFWILGIQAPVFWGVIMTLLALLPAVGTPIIWLPAAIILIIIGSWIKGLILIIAGTLIIGLVDNVLRPILVGRDTRIPDYLVLLSTIGGLVLFGISGFVIGPIIAALFLSVWEMFALEFNEKMEFQKEESTSSPLISDSRPIDSEDEKV